MKKTTYTYSTTYLTLDSLVPFLLTFRHVRIWGALNKNYKCKNYIEFIPRAAQFNPSDTKLMVAGVVDQVSGEIAIFKTGKSLSTAVVRGVQEGRPPLSSNFIEAPS